jgi:hypothetical protein
MKGKERVDGCAAALVMSSLRWWRIRVDRSGCGGRGEEDEKGNEEGEDEIILHRLSFVKEGTDR